MLTIILLLNKVTKISGKIIIIDLGAGVNGFSYKFFPKKVSYLGIESLGQLVNSMNAYFKSEKFRNAKAVHLSLFELKKLLKLIKKEKGKKIVFLFKVLDSLEALQKDYSKKLLKETVPLIERTVISFATKSMNRRKKIFSDREWIVSFIKNNFKILEEFGGIDEKYLVFSKR